MCLPARNIWSYLSTPGSGAGQAALTPVAPVTEQYGELQGGKGGGGLEGGRIAADFCRERVEISF